MNALVTVLIGCGLVLTGIAVLTVWESVLLPFHQRGMQRLARAEARRPLVGDVVTVDGESIAA